MSTPSLREQTDTPGLTYTRRHDISYRTGMVLQVLGAAILALLYPLESPFYTIGIMLFEAGVLLSAIYVLLSMKTVKKLIFSSVVIGLAMQVAGSLFVTEQYAGSALIGGIGFVCLGASGMAVVEAYRFGYREGWLLALIGFPFMVLVNLVIKENIILNSLGFSIVFLLLLSLAGKKLKQPLLNQRSENR